MSNLLEYSSKNSSWKQQELLAVQPRRISNSGNGAVMKTTLFVYKIINEYLSCLLELRTAVWMRKRRSCRRAPRFSMHVPDNYLSWVDINLHTRQYEIANQRFITQLELVIKRFSQMFRALYHKRYALLCNLEASTITKGECNTPNYQLKHSKHPHPYITLFLHCDS